MTTASDTATAPAFSPRVVLTLIAVGVFAFAGFLVLSAYAPDLRDGQGDGGAHALSRSAMGYAALERLLRAEGVPTVISRDDRPPTAGLWVLTLDERSDVDELLDTRIATTLVVLPKWQDAPHEGRAGWVRNAGSVEAAIVSRLLLQVRGRAPVRTAAAEESVDAVEAARAGGKPSASGAEGLIDRRGRAGPVRLSGTGSLFRSDARINFARVDRLQTFGDPSISPVLVDERGSTVLGQLPAPRQHVYVLSDPDLLNTQGLRDLGNARGAVLLMRSLAAGQGVTFDVTLHGYARGRTLLKAAFEPPFLAATLCLVAAALLMGFHAAVRFGPVARAGRVFALGKTALADNAAGLIALTGREARFLPAYASDTRTAVAREIGAPRDLAGETLDGFLDRVGRTLATGESWSALNAQAHDAHGPAEAAAVAARLHRWRTEMTHGRR